MHLSGCAGHCDKIYSKRWSLRSWKAHSRQRILFYAIDHLRQCEVERGELAFYTRGNDHDFPIRCSSAFHKTKSASPQANDISTLVGNVSLSHFICGLFSSQ